MRVRRILSGVLAVGTLAGLSVVAVGSAGPAVADTPAVGVVFLESGIMMHTSVPRVRSPRTGVGVTTSDFDGDGLDDIAAFGYQGVTGGAVPLPYHPNGVVVVTYSSTPRD